MGFAHLLSQMVMPISRFFSTRAVARRFVLATTITIVVQPTIIFNLLANEPHSTNVKTPCGLQLNQMASSVAMAPFRAAIWPFRTKMRAFITTTSILGLTAFIAPAYPTDEGKMSPALQTFYFVRDWSLSSSGNESQLKLLESYSTSTLPGSRISDRDRLSEVAQALNHKSTAYPQGIRIPETSPQESSK